MAFNRKQKLRDNIEAIRTAFILDRENRTATTEERAILQRYCGFGGLKCILNPAKELTDAVRWAKSDLELFAPTVELHRLIRENSKDETEYKRFVDSLKASVLTAFYTPKEITDTIADVLADYSVRPARMLEPSAGVGVFVDSMLRHSPNADVMAFEKDLLTGTILRHLYPDQKMRTCGFERKFYFSKFPISDRTIKIVKNIMEIERTENYILSGKTGLSSIEEKYNGWFVGYVETKSNVYFFATNVIPTDGLNVDDFISSRINVTKNALKQMNIMK